MVNLKLYRLAWVGALVLAAFALFTLRSPELVDLSDDPMGFDGARAMETLRFLAREHPGRVAGSNEDRQTVAWLSGQLDEIGYSLHIDEFAATINGRRVSLKNVWALSRGDAEGAFVVLASRDSPPLSTQGANNNASGIAAVLELARVFSIAAHAHPIVFLWTDGDAYGALGARAFIDRNPDLPILAVISLRQIAGGGARKLDLSGWSPTPDVAPPWLWVLARSAAHSESKMQAPLPNIFTQLLRLAVPADAGSQAPFVSHGIPAITLSAPGPRRQPAADTVDYVSIETLGRIGRAAERMVVSLDAAPNPATLAGDQVFFSKYRRLGGGAVTWALVALTLPLLLTTGDLWIRSLFDQTRTAATWLRLGLRLAPWLATLLVVYLANLVGLLPRSPGALIPPESQLAGSPRYLRVVLLALFLALCYHCAMAIERRLARRYPSGPESAVLVAHTTAAIIALVMILVNPFSLLLVLPAAVSWPLARPGAWYRSRLPVWSALSVVGLAFAYFSLRLHLGWDVWWYFFLLVENRSIPFTPIVLGLAFVAAAALLGHDLHRRAEVMPLTTARRQGRRPTVAGSVEGRQAAAEAASGPPEGGPLIAPRGRSRRRQGPRARR